MGSLQELITSLEGSHAVLKDMIAEVNTILEFSCGFQNEKGGRTVVSRGDHVPVPVLKWALRWLLRHLEDVVQNPTDDHLQPLFWDLFGDILTCLSANAIASSLRGHPILQYMNQAITLNLDTPAFDTASRHRHSSSETLVGTDAPASSPSIFSNQLKRKRGIEELRGPARKTQKLGEFPVTCKGQAPAFVPVTRCLAIIQRKIEGSPTVLTDYSQASLLMEISAEPASMASLLANALKNLRATVSTRVEEGKLTDLRTDLDKLFRPYQFIWDFETKGGHNSNDDFIKQFCLLCLVDALTLLSEIDPNTTSATVEFLDRVVFDFAVSPAKAKLPNTRDIDLASAAAILNEHLNTVLKSAQMSAHGTALPRVSSTGHLPETILFSIAATYARDAKLRSMTEDGWLSTLFQYLGGIVPSKDLQVSDADRERHIIVQAQLLSVCKQESIRIDRSLYENLISLTLLKYRGRKMDLSAWTIIGHCIALDDTLLVARPGTGERRKKSAEISKTTKALLKHVVSINKPRRRSQWKREEAYQNDLPQLEIAELVITSLILPLLRAYTRVRRFNEFAVCWYRELVKSYEHISLQGGSGALGIPDVVSVWEDTKVLAAVVASVRDASLPIELLTSLWDETQPEYDPTRGGEIAPEANLRSSYTVLSTIISGIKSEASIAGLKSRAKTVKDNMAQALNERPASDSKVWVLWAFESRLLDSWPRLFQHSDNLSPIAHAITTQALKDGFEDRNRNVLTLHAVAYLWRVLNLEFLSNVSLHAKDIGKLVCLSINTITNTTVESKTLDEASYMASNLIVLLLQRPGPLTLMDSAERKKLFRAMFEYASHIGLSFPSDPMTHDVESQRREIKFTETSLRGLLSLDVLRDHKESYDDLGDTLLKFLEDLRHEYDPNSKNLGSKEIGSIRLLFLILANRDFQDWTADQQRAVLKGSLWLAYIIQGYDLELSKVGLLVLKRMLTPRKGRSLARRHLQAVRDEVDRIDEKGQKPSGDAHEEILGQVRELISAEESAKAEEELATENTKSRTSNAVPKLGLMSTNDDARQALKGMKAGFEEASPLEREKIIRQWLHNFEKDPSDTNLVLARKLCAAKQAQEDRTASVREAFQELISRLFAIVFTSRSTKRVLLAQKAIAAAFRSNSWVLSQAHIDYAFASAANIATMRGSSEEEVNEVSLSHEAVAELPRTRSKLDVASAKRLVFGSLGLRTPKTKEEGAKLREKLDAQKLDAQKLDASRLPGTAPADASKPERETSDAHEEAPKEAAVSTDPRIPPALYMTLCETVSGLLLHHRTRIGGRWHLVVIALRPLLTCLFEPYHSSAKPAWIAGGSLTAAHATAFARLLTLLCEPSASAAASLSASRKKNKKNDQHAASSARAAADGHAMQLHDDIKRAKELAGQHLPLLLKAYCAASLRGQLSSDKKAALMPGLYALLGAVGRDGTEVLNEALSKLEREIFRGLWDEYLKFGKWQGK